MASQVPEETMMYQVIGEDAAKPGDVLVAVYKALKERGYNPINQLVGYLLSGDPAYITSYGNARGLIRRLERDELLEELIRSYLER